MGGGVEGGMGGGLKYSFYILYICLNFTVFKSCLFYNSSNFEMFLISSYNHFTAKFSNNFGKKMSILLSAPYLNKYYLPLGTGRIDKDCKS